MNESVVVTPSSTGDDVSVSVNETTQNVTVNVTQNDDSVEVYAETNVDLRLSWIGLATGAIPTGPTAITGGRVYTYDYGATTRYRFISTDNLTDNFYTTFDGVSMPTNLIATKALNF